MPRRRSGLNPEPALATIILGSIAAATAGCQVAPTDNGCQIIDVRGLSITDPIAMERDINQWPGVVSVGIFARNRANVCLLGTPQGVRTLTF